MLIVLGMISFMVISAVAFSALMRYSRLPSSYLRRTSSSRHLAHAALAEAIDYIDVAIGNNPHPGFGTQSSRYPRKNGDTLIRNYWRDRCFIGTNQLVSASETVSTLTLEGLAYIPPSLINEARYFSRHCETARWQDLGYDSGRFAFFALDVSDCFNLNRVPANWARNSSDLGKISLAYALEDANHSGYTVNPSDWDDFMKDFVEFDKIMDGVASVSKMPLVSIADMNLAINYKAKKLVQYMSPFCNYINGADEFVLEETGEKAELMRAMNVITDGYYPPMSIASDEADIYNPGHQPFTRVDSGNTQPPNRQVLQRIRTTGIGKILSNELPTLDMINLYDYLDENDIPTSLGLPTTERVPMICGLESMVRLVLQPKAEKSESANAATVKAKGGTYEETTTCTMQVKGSGTMSTLYMFPFLRQQGNASFTAETAARICLSVGDGPGMRVKSSSRYVVQAEGDFAASGVADSTIRAKGQNSSLSFSKVTKPEDALKLESAKTVNISDAGSWFNGKALLTIKRVYKVDLDEDGNPKPPVELTEQREATVNEDFRPVSADGTGDGGLTVEKVKNGEGVTVRPYMTVTTRVKSNASSKTVDLVPASGLDDKKYNNINSDTVIANISGGTSSQPIITLRGDQEFVFGEEFFTKGEQKEIKLQLSESGGSITCPDPRWNFAPENFVLNSGSLNQSTYLNECGVGSEGRDCDIFMFVSNQGYLQSISELAFLPRTAIDFGGGRSDLGDCSFSFNKTSFETDKANLPHWNLMWRTYRLWAEDGASADGLYDLGVFDGGRGPRVNPYSDSVYSIYAALANTPVDWWAASTNYTSTSKSSVPDDDAEAFNERYAFSEMNSDAKFKWDSLKQVAANLQSAMRSNDNGNWVEGWENMDWDGEDPKSFLGVDLNGLSLYDVDRKFLYGYWRDCFAAKQQLFLVFVRAEPLMMGGGSARSTPPQLGARAVALVWRNPTSGSGSNIVAGPAATLDRFRPNGARSTTEANMPHQTRVLFYRQFD